MEVECAQNTGQMPNQCRVGLTMTRGRQSRKENTYADNFEDCCPDCNLHQTEALGGT